MTSSEQSEILCHPYCQEQLEKVASDDDLESLRAPIRALLWGIREGPEEFDRLHEGSAIRVAKSTEIHLDDEQIPPIRVFFVVNNDGPKLLYIHAPPHLAIPSM